MSKQTGDKVAQYSLSAVSPRSTAGGIEATPAPLNGYRWRSNTFLTAALSRHVEFSRLISYTPNQLPIAVNGLLAAAAEWAIKRGYRA
jgi:hypothetical protein